MSNPLVYVGKQAPNHPPNAVAAANGRTSYWMWCPGCKGTVRIDDTWDFDGNLEAPTFSPSLLTRWDGVERVCHSFIRNGHWEFLADSTHELAGQTVPMVPLPDWFMGRP